MFSGTCFFFSYEWNGNPLDWSMDVNLAVSSTTANMLLLMANLNMWEIKGNSHPIDMFHTKSAPFTHIKWVQKLLQTNMQLKDDLGLLRPYNIFQMWCKHICCGILFILNGPEKKYNNLFFSELPVTFPMQPSYQTCIYSMKRYVENTWKHNILLVFFMLVLELQCYSDVLQSLSI